MIKSKAVCKSQIQFTLYHFKLNCGILFTNYVAKHEGFLINVVLMVTLLLLFHNKNNTIAGKTLNGYTWKSRRRKAWPLLPRDI